MSYPFDTKTVVEFFTEFPKEMTEEGTPEVGPWTFPRPRNFGKLKNVKIREKGIYVRISDLINKKSSKKSIVSAPLAISVYFLINLIRNPFRKSIGSDPCHFWLFVF